MAELDTALETLKVGKAAREQLVEAAKSDMAKARQRARSALDAAKSGAFETGKGSVASAIGGAVAEPVRRNIVGRLTSDVRLQGLGLIGAGFGVAALAGALKVPYLREVGHGHSAVGGWMISVSLHGDDKKPDPVKVALEATTYKAKHPKAADK